MKMNPTKIYDFSVEFSQHVHLKTKHSSLVLGVADSVYQLYYGTRIGAKSAEELTRGYEGKHTKATYPIYSAFGADNNHGALRVTHADGSVSIELEYQSHLLENHPDGELLKIILTDSVKSLTLTVFFKTYRENDVIEQWVVAEHAQDGEITIHQMPSIDLCFDHSERYYLTSFTGLWEREAEVQEEKLSFGKKVLDNRYGTWSSFGFLPAFMLSFDQPADENTSNVIAGALAWSGAWKMEFDLNDGPLTHDTVPRKCLNIRAGSNDFAAEYKLSKGERYETPKLITTYSAKGKGLASRNLHRWARQHKLRAGDELRPIILNSWEGAYFNFDEPLLLGMMDNLAEMGGEMFVLDDGWFGNGEYARNGANAGLGDWQINTEKLPHSDGLNHLATEAQKRGLSFGIWVEPEMVNPQSQLFVDHPDWVIYQSEREALLYRNQLVLDLSNPAVLEFVYDSVAVMLQENPKISYVKWDCNRCFTNLGSQYLSSDKQTHLWYDYVQGLYGVYHKLTENFPNVMLQLCASGGGRIDYGALEYHHEFWASDNTDALQRIFIQWGVNHIYPAIATAAHVSICPNHQTGRTLPLKYRFDVAMSGRMGLELNPKDMEPDELSFVKQAVECYKLIRPVIQFGDLYRLVSPHENSHASLMYTHENQAVVFAYKIAHHLGLFIPLLKLQGLDPQASYRVTEVDTIDTIDAATYSGEFLMNQGMTLDLKAEYASVVYLLEKVEASALAEH